MILEDDNEFDNDQLQKLSNLFQMYLYLISWFLRLFDFINDTANDKDMGIKKKGQRKVRPDNGFLEQKHSTLVLVYNCIQLPFHNLFNPPVPEPELIS